MTLSGIVLTPKNVYAGLSVIRVMKHSIEILPEIINSIIQTKISLNRIQEYFMCKDQELYVECQNNSEAILMKSVSFA